MGKKLTRSRQKRMVAGVCGGIAEFFNIDETIVRLGTVLLTIGTGLVPGLIFYFAAATIMPE